MGELVDRLLFKAYKIRDTATIRFNILLESVVIMEQRMVSILSLIRACGLCCKVLGYTYYISVF